MKQATLYVRGSGWEVNVTRRPVYNFLRGPSTWRADLALRPLDGTTGLEAAYGRASTRCHPHGLLGQSWDGDDVAVSGATDDYATDAAVVTTRAMAEGAIDGEARDYALSGPRATQFRFSRFNGRGTECARRAVASLRGPKTRSTGAHAASAADAE